MVSQPSYDNLVIPVQRRFTQYQRELVACRAFYRRNVRQLRVYAHDLYDEPCLVALISIKDGKATIREVTTNGGLKKPTPIRCNGSVSKADMRKALGFGEGTTVFAKTLHYSDLKYRR